MKTMKRIRRLTVALAIAAGLTGSLTETVEAGAKGESTDMEMLRGYGQTEWRTHNLAPDRWKEAVAAAPITKGLWPRNDESIWKEDMRLSIEFHCAGYRKGGFPYSYLKVMWFQDKIGKRNWGAGIEASDPPLASNKSQKWGGSILARWYVSIGGSGAWQLSYWERGRPPVFADLDNGWFGGSVKEIYVYSLRGKNDQEGSLGDEGHGLTEGEVRRLQRADVLMFRLPYVYAHRDSYETKKGLSSKEWKGLKREVRWVKGENEWHISMKGSRDAIQGALDICQSEPEAEK